MVYNIHLAVKEGNFIEIQRLVNEGASVNSIDRRGVTPLMLAAHTSRIDIAKYLLSKGAETEARAPFLGDTAFLTACFNGNLEMVQLLIEHGAEVQAVNHRGIDALMYASEGGFVKIVKLIMSYFSNSIDRCNKRGKTSLMYASNGAHLEIVELLLKNGANINAASRHGWTALIYACVHSSVDVVELLLRNGANIQQLNRDGESALMAAVLDWRYDIVNFLLKNGAAVDATNHVGSSALYEACRQSNMQMALLLVRFGANPHLKSTTGSTPLDALKRPALQDQLKKEFFWNRRRNLVLCNHLYIKSAPGRGTNLAVHKVLFNDDLLKHITKQL